MTNPESTTRRHPGIAALFAIGVYLVLALSQVIQTFGYVAGSYTADVANYFAAMLPTMLPGWFLAPLPFAIVVWLGLGVMFPIRADLRTSGVVGRVLLTALVGVAVSGIAVAIGAFVALFFGTVGYGEVTVSADLVIQRFGSIISSAVDAMVALLTIGTLATLSAALLMRECLRHPR